MSRVLYTCFSKIFLEETGAPASFEIEIIEKPETKLSYPASFKNCLTECFILLENNFLFKEIIQRYQRNSSI